MQRLDIHAPIAGDAAPSFHDDSHADVPDQLLWFMGFWSVITTPADVASMLRHFERFVCSPPPPVRRSTRRVRPGP